MLGAVALAALASLGTPAVALDDACTFQRVGDWYVRVCTPPATCTVFIENPHLGIPPICL